MKPHLNLYFVAYNDKSNSCNIPRFSINSLDITVSIKPKYFDFSFISLVLSKEASRKCLCRIEKLFHTARIV